jgi:hypothetical protein
MWFQHVFIVVHRMHFIIVSSLRMLVRLMGLDTDT